MRPAARIAHFRADQRPQVNRSGNQQRCGATCGERATYVVGEQGSAIVQRQPATQRQHYAGLQTEHVLRRNRGEHARQVCVPQPKVTVLKTRQSRQRAPVLFVRTRTAGAAGCEHDGGCPVGRNPRHGFGPNEPAVTRNPAVDPRLRPRYGRARRVFGPNPGIIQVEVARVPGGNLGHTLERPIVWQQADLPAQQRRAERDRESIAVLAEVDCVRARRDPFGQRRDVAQETFPGDRATAMPCDDGP